METNGQGVRKFDRQEEFLENFFKLTDFPLARLADLNGVDYYVLARISLNPVRIVPPLNIITLFSSGATTPWVESSPLALKGQAF